MNNRCMDVPNGNGVNGVQLLVWDCNNGRGQKFTIANGFLKYENKCVAAYDNGVRGARVGIWDCVDHPSQKWVLQSDGHLRGMNNLCLRIANASSNNGSGLILWDCVNAPNQLWRAGVSSAYTPPPAPVAVDRSPLVRNSYSRAFGREPRADELKYWNSLPASDPRVGSVDAMIGKHRTFLKQGTGERQSTITRSYAAPVAAAAPAPMTAAPGKVMTNAAGKHEFCFGGVGKSCEGAGASFYDGRSDLLTGFKLGCSPEVNGFRNCWVVPGSIKHDNCCAKNSNGKQCGGKTETSACANEWEMASNDVATGRGWVQTLENGPNDLTPVASSRYTPGETVTTAKLCAPGGTNISEYHTAAFCCSGRFKEIWWAPSWGNSMTQKWGVCADPGSYSLQSASAPKQWNGAPPAVRPINTPPAPPSPSDVQRVRSGGR